MVVIQVKLCLKTVLQYINVHFIIMISGQPWVGGQVLTKNQVGCLSIIVFMISMLLTEFCCLCTCCLILAAIYSTVVTG